ncbi:hypothetical protein M758_UG187400 [Ceratodon purpureus]|nr:hypothetical protein M758_UG187400 [Ceratodon purpureus]
MYEVVYVPIPSSQTSRDPNVDVGTTSTPMTHSQLESPPDLEANDTVEPFARPLELNSVGLDGYIFDLLLCVWFCIIVISSQNFCSNFMYSWSSLITISSTLSSVQTSLFMFNPS